jgi:hypothetical protein
MEAAPLLKIQLRRLQMDRLGGGSHGLGLSCTLGTVWAISGLSGHQIRP